MRIIRSGAALLFAAWVGLCFVPPFTPAPPAASGYHLVFHEDFSNFDLSPDGHGIHTWYEGVWFNPKHAPISNIAAAPSLLTLTWARNQGSPDTSITTLSKDLSHSTAWRYGYFEAHMKWDVAPGAWPALWLIPTPDRSGKATYKDTKESGELDIFEGQGDQPHTFFGTVHNWTDMHDHPNQLNHFPLPVGTDFSQFHNYGALWVPGKVTWYFDDRPLHSEPVPEIFDKQDYFLVLGMQEGANWKTNDLTGVQAAKLTLTVNWIRVWQK